MKKQLLFSLGCAVAATAMAATDPVVLPEFYSMKISADGSVIVSEGYESVDLYYVATGERIVLPAYRLGSGNCVSADGSIVVGATESDQPVMLKNGEEVDLTSFSEEFASCNFNAITGDGSRVIGWVLNPDMSSEYNPDGNIMYVPMYFDVNADGTFGEVNILPYPDKDWLGMAPQYVTASFISNDGKTIMGQVVDNSGMAVYPIVFTQGSDDKWSYSLVTESLINPNKLPIPEMPAEFTEIPPEIQDYMTPEEYQQYQDAYDAWVESGYQLEYPEFYNFMTDEEIAAYNEAADAYNEKANAYNEVYNKYFEDLQQIMAESTFFLRNGFAMDAEGKVAAMAADVEVEDNSIPEWPTLVSTYPTYMIDLATSEIKKLEDLGDDKYPLPSQILSDGSVIASTPQPSMWSAVQRPPQGFVLLPGADKFVGIEEKIAEVNPMAMEWMNEKYKKTITVGYDWDTDEELTETMLMTGHVCVSDNWSVISGGVMAYLFNQDEESEEEGNTLESYVITSEINAIDAVAADAKVLGVKYYDINGFEIKNPEQGFYIVRTTLSDGTIRTAKIVKK